MEDQKSKQVSSGEKKFGNKTLPKSAATEKAQPTNFVPLKKGKAHPDNIKEKKTLKVAKATQTQKKEKKSEEKMSSKLNQFSATLSPKTFDEALKLF